MTNKEFDTSLLRFIATGTYISVLMQVSRELFSKSYFSLSVAEKTAVEQTANTTIGANYQQLTPEYLWGQPRNPVGFEGPKAPLDEKK